MLLGMYSSFGPPGHSSHLPVARGRRRVTTGQPWKKKETAKFEAGCLVFRWTHACAWETKLQGGRIRYKSVRVPPLKNKISEASERYLKRLCVCARFSHLKAAPGDRLAAVYRQSFFGLVARLFCHGVPLLVQWSNDGGRAVSACPAQSCGEYLCLHLEWIQVCSMTRLESERERERERERESVYVTQRPATLPTRFTICAFFF